MYVNTHRYAWGISWDMSMIVVALIGIWLWGMYGLWVDAVKHSDGEQRRMRFYSTILDVSQPLVDSLGLETKSCRNMR